MLMELDNHHIALRMHSFALALEEIKTRFPTILAVAAHAMLKNAGTVPEHTLTVQAPSISTGGITASSILVYRSARGNSPALAGLEIIINGALSFYLGGSSEDDNIEYRVDLLDNGCPNLYLTEIELIRRSVEALEAYVKVDSPLEG